MRFEVKRVPIELPLYSLLEVSNAVVRRAANCENSNSVYFFSGQALAAKALETLQDESLRPVEHADRDRLANFLEELETEHGLTHVIVDPDLERNSHAWECSLANLIAQLREE